MKYLGALRLSRDANSSLKAATKQQIDAAFETVAKGYVTAARIAADSNTDASGGGTTAVTGMSITATLAAGRAYWLHWYGGIGGTGTTTIGRVALTEGGSVLHDTARVSLATTNAGFNASCLFRINNPSAGSHTYIVTVEAVNGSGTAFVDAGATLPSFLVLEDAGVAL